MRGYFLITERLGHEWNEPHVINEMQPKKRWHTILAQTQNTKNNKKRLNIDSPAAWRDLLDEEMSSSVSACLLRSMSASLQPLTATIDDDDGVAMFSYDSPQYEE